MLFRDRLIKSKKFVGAGVLALVAVVASLKGQHSVPENQESITTDVKEQREKALKDAVQKGKTKEEVARYIDFPEFIPVTRDGQFDKQKANKWGRALAPYVKVLAKEGNKITKAKAYKAFKTSVGMNVSYDDFNNTLSIAKNACAVGKMNSELLFLGTGLLLFGAYSGYAMKKEIDEAKRTGDGLNTVIMLGIVSAFFTIGGCGVIKMSVSTPPEKIVSDTYFRMYNAHVKETIFTVQENLEKEKKQLRKLTDEEVIRSFLECKEK